MRRLLFIGIVSISLVFNGCTSSHSQPSNTELSAKEFSEQISQKPAVQLVDVRTPDEFSKGHLKDAMNIDWKSDAFEEQMATLDKSKPIYVYCLSGKRSADAMDKMRSEGFTKVYGLSGGMMKWRAASLPEVAKNSNETAGMSKQQFDEMISSDKLVLVDFYADWCAPCKKMKPYLDEISKDMADKVVVISINADDNQQLCKDLNVDGLPVLQLYKNKIMTWKNTGYIEKEEVLKVLQ